MHLRHSPLLLLFALAACSSPPQPPTVDGSSRRPANTPSAVELQVCKNDLQNTRILAVESNRSAESAAAALARASALQSARHAASLAAAQSKTFTVHFGFRSAKVTVPESMERSLIESAKSAPLVMLRGRTDGETDSIGESRMARERANAVRDYLVGSGVDAARIRTTYQPVGDHLTENTSPSGRALNRRVEIEIYSALPVLGGTPDAPTP